jgi:hypothetical protein
MVHWHSRLIPRSSDSKRILCLCLVSCHRYERRSSREALERAKLLDEADFFTSAHTAAAQAGQSAVPTDLDVDTHFIAFIEAINDQG